MTSSTLDYLELCRLCLEKDRAQVPIFGEGEVSQIFLKIHACLPVKVSSDDKLPKKICDGCFNKVNDFYSYWNTTANAEKQLLQWLNQMEGLEDKQGYITEVLDSNVMKREQSSDSRLDGSVMQVSGHENMDINMIENMSIITMPAGSEQQFTTVPIDTGGIVQTVQVSGPSTQIAHDQTHLQEVEVDEDDDNMDDGCDNDDGLPVKEETDEGERSLEQTYVTLPCDEAGPSGMQQQKISEMSEITIQQTADGDPKTGYYVTQDGKVSEDSTIKVYSADTTTPTIIIATADGKHTTMDGEPVVIMGDIGNVEGTLHLCAVCREVLVDDQLDYHQCRIGHLAVPKIENTDEQSNDFPMYGCVCGEAFVDEETCEQHKASCEKSIADQQQEQQELPTPSPLRQIKLDSKPTKKFHCAECDYTTPHRQNLTGHCRRHTKDYKIQCDKCGVGFYEHNVYKEHVLAVHSETNSFQCKLCPATFRYRQGLRLHGKLHQPDYEPPQKKHACEICSKRFCRRQVLTVHMRTHGNGNGPPNEFICRVCGKAVSSKTYLAVHLRKHTGEKPHGCDTCGKRFISQNYLSVHKRTHTGERPHTCTYCNKSFTQRTTLVVHQRSHTGVKPYPCEWCNKSFASKTMLNSHMKTHTKQTVKTQEDQEIFDLQEQKLILSPEEQAMLAQQHEEEIVEESTEDDKNDTLPPS